MKIVKKSMSSFARGYLGTYTRFAFLLYHADFQLSIPTKYQLTDFKLFLLALDGYARLTKSSKSVKLIRKFIMNVLCLRIEEFDFFLRIQCERERFGKVLDYDSCVKAGKKSAKFFKKLNAD